MFFMDTKGLKSDKNFVYHHYGIQWWFIPLIVVQGVALAFLCWIFIRHMIVFLIIGILLLLLFWYIFKKEKSSYKIYDNRIEFFNEYSPELKDVIGIDDIIQVRYEDEFGDGYDFKEWFIYLYLDESKEYKSPKIKKNRIRLKIKRKGRVKNIITILQSFKAQHKPVYVQTKYSAIQKALINDGKTDKYV